MRIRLLGTFEVVLGERTVQAFRSDKTRALLAYLAVEADRPHRREALAELMWPDQPRINGLTSLRQALCCLRHCLHRDGEPPLLVTTPHDVHVSCQSRYWLDVAELQARFDRCLAHHASSGPLCGDCLASLAVAAALYRGPFLAGLSPAVGVDFDNWLVATQEEIHWRALAVLDLLGRDLEARGDLAAAETCARREIELEPCRESAHRRVMRTLAHAGQRSMALQAYDRCRTVLMTQLGVGPAPETAKLAERIAAGALQAP